MFKIDKSTNRITRLQNKRFSDLGFSERNHLQEWLAYQPDAFGEELLIIQKEFDGLGPPKYTNMYEKRQGLYASLSFSGFRI